MIRISVGFEFAKISDSKCISADEHEKKRLPMKAGAFGSRSREASREQGLTFPGVGQPHVRISIFIPVVAD
jgi:hypothetical protein